MRPLHNAHSAKTYFAVTSSTDLRAAIWCCFEAAVWANAVDRARGECEIFPVISGCEASLPVIKFEFSA